MAWVNSDYVERETLNSYRTAMVICRMCFILSRSHFLSSSLFPGTSTTYYSGKFRLAKSNYHCHQQANISSWGNNLFTLYYRNPCYVVLCSSLVLA